MFQIIKNIPVWGEPLNNAVDQMVNCLKTADGAALMANHHLGYAVPVGGVIAYRDKISPSAVGFDISCGNFAVLTNLVREDISSEISKIMDEVIKHISFGVGRINNEKVDHSLFDDTTWALPMVRDLKDMARNQLGTVGSGNHYLDIFYDERNRIWVGCHFGSRGLGHKIASFFIKAGGGTDGINVDPVVFDANSSIGSDYIACMNLAGKYAYGGREWVVGRVLKILGATQLDGVHNHHNFAWKEKHSIGEAWVIRKGATPAFPGQKGFVGDTMGENSVILEGVESDEGHISFYSTVHGAGRVMSRTEAAGKTKWKNGVKTRVSEGKISQNMMDEWILKSNVELRGAGVDESPHAYKRLSEVLGAHSKSVRILHVLTPMGVAMAGNEFDPYKD